MDTGEGIHKVDSAGVDYWIYFADGRASCHKDVVLPVKREYPRAEPEDLDRAYKALLEELNLSEEHRADLTRRGFRLEDIKRYGYRSFPVRGRAALAKKLVERFGADICASVPGLFLKTDPDGEYWSLAGPAGMLIPVRDPEGRIVALKVRVDDPGVGPKYLYVSSKKYDGPGPGAPIHVPLHASGTTSHTEIRLTEGELKADLASTLDPVFTVSIPGVSAWRGIIPYFQNTGAQSVRLAFDADFNENNHVARGLVRTALAIERKTLATVALELWSPDKGKGIDDLLANGHVPRLHEGLEARRYLIRIAEDAGMEADSRWRGRVAMERIMSSPDPSEAILKALTDQKLLRDLGHASTLERGPFEAMLRDLERRGARDKDTQSLKRAVNAEQRLVQKEERAGSVQVKNDLTLPPCEASEAGIFWIKRSEQGEEIREQLTNFVAQIVADIKYDDGAEIRRVLELEAKLRGVSFPRFTIPAPQFMTMGWVVENLGAHAVICPGFAVRDRTRAAIQYLSRQIESRTVFQHLGWRKVGDTWIYLHAGGAIGPKGPIPEIEVALEGNLERFTLPSPCSTSDLQDSVLKVLGLLSIMPEEIGFSLLAAAFRAALGRSCPFVIHIVGLTGTGKTEILALFQQFYGAGMSAKFLPGSWSSTGNALEALAFQAKDALLGIDDLAPDGGHRDIDRQHREAARLIRAQGNQAGRSRMRADATLRPVKYPRGLVVSTGEDIPRGHSVSARLIVLELSSGGLDWDALSGCQQDAAGGIYARCMAMFVQWLASRFEAFQADLQDRVLQLRAQASRKGQHRRVPDTVAELALGLVAFLDFARDLGALVSGQVEDFWTRGWEALIQIGEAQAHHQDAFDPVSRFLELVSSALGSGHAHVADPAGGRPGNAIAWGWRCDDTGSVPLGTCIGWVDGDNLYLDPNVSFKVAQQMSGSGDGILISSRTLSKRLHERGYLTTTEQHRGHLTVRRILAGERRNVLHLTPSALFPRRKSAQSAQSVQDDQEPGQNGDSRGDQWAENPGDDEESARTSARESAWNPVEDMSGGPNGPIGPISGGGPGEESGDNADDPAIDDGEEDGWTL